MKRQKANGQKSATRFGRFPAVTEEPDREVIVMSLERLDRSATPTASCCRCGQQVSAALLWSTQPQSESGGIWCAACLAMDSWRTIVATVLAYEETEHENRRCDRCQRRSRPTTLHYGFNVCEECIDGERE